MRFDDVPVEDERGRRLASAVRTLFHENRRLRERLAQDAGLSQQEFAAVLAVLEEDATTPKDLADELSLTPSAVTALLDRLEARELVHRQPHPTDRRSVQVAATADGARLMHGIFRSYIAAISSVLVPLDEAHEEVDHLIELLLRLADAVKVLDPGSPDDGSA
jgi:DNA-binding MarR family transcriptional regulator